MTDNNQECIIDRLHRLERVERAAIALCGCVCLTQDLWDDLRAALEESNRARDGSLAADGPVGRQVQEPIEGPMRYYILSLKHSQGSVLTWWGPNSAGYTVNLNHAGLYSQEAAKDIEVENMHNGIRSAVAVPEEVAIENSHRAVGFEISILTAFCTTIQEIHKSRDL
jgi:hypothetical protein